MKYFTANLWCQMNNEDYNIRTAAAQQWEQNSKSYKKHFESIKACIPNSVLNALEQTNGFHDFIITKATIQQTRKGYVSQLELRNGTLCFCMEMAGIKCLDIDLKSLQACIFGKLHWGYHEFNITADGTLQLSILCDIENELFFEFESIKCAQSKHRLLFSYL